MMFSEQASALATAWANHAELRSLGAKMSLCVLKQAKLKRSA